MNSMLKEFRDFAMKGNVIDMAIGIIIGAGFGKIVSSLVNDILMPPLGLLIGGVDFSDKKIVIKQALEGAPEVAIKYGIFLNTLIDFTIVAFAIFMTVKIMNRMKKEAEAAKESKPAVAVKSSQEKLLEEIRDLLKR